MNARALQTEEYFIEKEPYHEAIGDEISIFESAYRQGLPVLLKGPTGCGKTRSVVFNRRTTPAWGLRFIT